MYPAPRNSFFDRKYDEFADACDDAWRRVLDFPQWRGVARGWVARAACAAFSSPCCPWPPCLAAAEPVRRGGGSAGVVTPGG